MKKNLTSGAENTTPRDVFNGSIDILIFIVSTEKAPSSSVFGIHVPVPIPIPVPVDPYTHQPLPGHISHGVYYPPVPQFGTHRIHYPRPFNTMNRYHPPYDSYPNPPNKYDPPLPYDSNEHPSIDPYAHTPNKYNPPLPHDSDEHPSIENIPKEDGNTPPSPNEMYLHPLTDDIPKEDYKTPVIHHSLKDLYNGPPVIDPIHPDAEYVHPVSHHIFHNGKIYSHRANRIQGPTFIPMHVARPSGPHGMGYSLDAYEPRGPDGGFYKNSIKQSG